MPGRNWQSSNSKYRYGMNGQEHDPESFNGESSAEHWMYDGRIGRRFEMDPLAQAYESPYATFDNNPIVYADPSGAIDIEEVGQEAADVAQEAGEGAGDTKTPLSAPKEGDTYTTADGTKIVYDANNGWTLHEATKMETSGTSSSGGGGIGVSESLHTVPTIGGLNIPINISKSNINWNDYRAIAWKNHNIENWWNAAVNDVMGGYEGEKEFEKKAQTVGRLILAINPVWNVPSSINTISMKKDLVTNQDASHWIDQTLAWTGLAFSGFSVAQELRPIIHSVNANNVIEGAGKLNDGASIYNDLGGFDDLKKDSENEKKK